MLVDVRRLLRGVDHNLDATDVRAELCALALAVSPDDRAGAEQEPRDLARCLVARSDHAAPVDAAPLATPPEWRLLVEFIAQTGLRIGEALALRWADIDFGRRRLRVYRGRVGPPKSRYGRREVPLTPEMSQRLWERSTAADPVGLVFPNRVGKHLDYKKLHQTWLKPSARKAGVPWCGFGSLRHTCATMLFRHGLNAGQVQLWLGHHSPAFTLSTYVHLLPSDLPEPPAAFAAMGRGAQLGRSPTQTGQDDPPLEPPGIGSTSAISS
jgi:integrase